MAAKKPSLREYTYAQLKQRIVDCTYAPNTVINEEQLQNEFGVSRTPIREALTMLEREGFVQIMPKKGIRIAGLTFSDVSYVFEARMLMEPYIVRQHGLSIGRQQLHFFEQKHRELLAPGVDTGAPAYHKAVNALDYELHSSLISASHNPYLSELRSIVLAQSSRLRILSGQQVEQRLQSTLSEHLAILEALLAGDANRAAECMEIHLAEAERAALATIAANHVQIGL